MRGINVGRWILGGLVAGVVIWLIEGAASMLYMGVAEAALAEHGFAMDLTAGFIAATVLVSVITGLVLIFVYAAMRPRFGAGARTAVVAAVTLWSGGYLMTLIGYGMIGLYPSGLLVIWGAIGLAEMIMASLVGGMIYREVPAT